MIAKIISQIILFFMGKLTSFVTGWLLQRAKFKKIEKENKVITDRMENAETRGKRDAANRDAANRFGSG